MALDSSWFQRVARFQGVDGLVLRAVVGVNAADVGHQADETDVGHQNCQPDQSFYHDHDYGAIDPALQPTRKEHRPGEEDRRHHN